MPDNIISQRHIRIQPKKNKTFYVLKSRNLLYNIKISRPRNLKGIIIYMNKVLYYYEEKWFI